MTLRLLTMVLLLDETLDSIAQTCQCRTGDISARRNLFLLFRKRSLLGFGAWIEDLCCAQVRSPKAEKRVVKVECGEQEAKGYVG
jgi:hypothetical protein